MLVNWVFDVDIMLSERHLYPLIVVPLQYFYQQISLNSFQPRPRHHIAEALSHDERVSHRRIYPSPNSIDGARTGTDAGWKIRPLGQHESTTSTKLASATEGLRYRRHHSSGVLYVSGLGYVSQWARFIGGADLFPIVPLSARQE